MILVCMLLGFISEILIFLKWYVAVRRRITTNSLQLLLNKVNSSGFNPLNQSEADEKIVKENQEIGD